ncbi:la-related protein 1C-like [Bidens hawaiensis]|uniref:la-related protein 1C-like n=1 Tax=Bidens hawaiensis TaxID=980011 RepID=UPI00404B9626
MTAGSSNVIITHSGGSISSPSGGSTLPTPWTQVVLRGIEPDSSDPVTAVNSPVQSPIVDSPVQSPEVDFPAPETAETQPEVSDGSNSCNGGGELRSVWAKPLANGVMEGTNSPVMNDSLWPALPESTRTGVKAALSVSTESSPKPATVSQAPVIPQPPQKQLKPILNPNHVRQRSTRSGGSTGGASVHYNRPPLNPPPFPLFDIYGNLVPAVTEFPQPSFKTNNWSPRSSNKNPARRNNLGPRPVNIGYSGRRDHRGPLGPLVRGFVPPPFIPYQSFRPYVGYETGASYVYVPVPLVPHGAIPYWDTSLHGSILKQIEYYFRQVFILLLFKFCVKWDFVFINGSCDSFANHSDENLVKDNFLRSHMDDEGWVPITLIAGFQRVKKLTNDLQMILSSLAYSNTVEIQGDKVRRRADWRRWIHVPREVFGEEASFQKLKLEVGLTNEKLVSR